MDVEVRNTVEADLQEIFQIRTDPLVSRNQFRIPASDTPDLWAQQLFGQQVDGQPLFRCSTILVDGQIAGHVSHQSATFGDQLTAYCGWNLAPAFWGQGIMHRALSEWLGSLHQEHQVDVAIADCFSSNRRCLRLLRKLGFGSIPIDLSGRIQILMQHNCWHWIHRFRLITEDFVAAQ